MFILFINLSFRKRQPKNLLNLLEKGQPKNLLNLLEKGQPKIVAFGSTFF